MERPAYLKKIRERIKAANAGSVFVATDFADVAENVIVGVCLSRLEEEKTLFRIMRGVYYKPNCLMSLLRLLPMLWRTRSRETSAGPSSPAETRR